MQKPTKEIIAGSMTIQRTSLLLPEQNFQMCLVLCAATPSLFHSHTFFNTRKLSQKKLFERHLRVLWSCGWCLELHMFSSNTVHLPTGAIWNKTGYERILINFGHKNFGPQQPGFYSSGLLWAEHSWKGL